MASASYALMATAETLYAPELMQEAWGDVVDRREFLYDDPSFNLGSDGTFGAYAPFSSISDRSRGEFRPVYQNETDLAAIRGVTRAISQIDSVAIGASDALANYIFGAKGFEFTVQPAKGHEEDAAAKPLREIAQKIIDRFIDRNDLTGELDREVHARSREDGEAFVALVKDDGGTRAEVFEPDQLTEPAIPSGLYAWLFDRFAIDCDAFSPCWSFGILTPERRTSQPIGYHVVYDGSGRDWDFLPASQVVHFKRNVTRNAKRGISDFYAIAEDAKNELKLRRNTVTGAALQASIPWIESFPTGTTRADVSSLGSSQADSIVKRPTQATGGRDVPQRRYRPGTIVRTSPGHMYSPGPLGTERADNFIKVAGFVSRCIGVRWNMPEYMITGDASNSNYASTLVAESPFVKAREYDQHWYGVRFVNLLWKVLRIEYGNGAFEKVAPGMKYREIESILEVAFEAPKVASRDPLQMAQTHEIQLRTGEISLRTARIEGGYDPDEQEKQGAKPAPLPGALPGGAGIDPLTGKPLAPKVPGMPGGQKLGPDGKPIQQQQRPGQPGQRPAFGQHPAAQAALEAALGSVETTDEAREILETVSANYP